MALLPPSYLDTVVAIGFAPPGQTTNWAATGFLFGKYMKPGEKEGTIDYKVFVVTNRHVLQDQRSVQLRFNPRVSEEAREYFALLEDANGTRQWAGHPNSAIDVAVCPINANRLRDDDIQFDFFRDRTNNIMRRQDAVEAGLHEGDGAFILGFPMALVGEQRNYVIVRGATFARIRDCLAGSSNEFLVDAAVFPGNSGGPVVTKPEIGRVGGTKPITTASVVGIIHGYLPYEDIAVSNQTGKPRVIFAENSGLAGAHPMDCVEETIDYAFQTLPQLTDVPVVVASPEPPEDPVGDST